MKLASLKKERDGRLVIVSSDLSQYVEAADYQTMQQALDHWSEAKGKLETQYQELEAQKNGKPFDPKKCASPLPRAYHIADGSAYLNHVELVRKARGAEMPPEFLHDPLMYQAVSDTILGPTDDVPVPSEEFGIDFEAEVAVITDDVPMGITPDEALSHVQLIMIMNDVSLRNLIPNELGKGFGFYQSKPPSSFSPVAVTPDELGEAWRDGKLHLPLRSIYNGKTIGQPNAGVDMQFHFGQLIAHAARTRPLGAGTIIGSGTISNHDRKAGISCFAEIRMIEKIDSGEFQTPFMKYGDKIRIEMMDQEGNSIFGAIEQEIVPYKSVSQVPERKMA
ncbi:MAG: fumarylacetoacetate hydrolase family protein [Alphaproteobacteria bacterium]|nr:fumarylacetoacetate hydrolase family protein [Alphaproteobacteria bacterium]